MAALNTRIREFRTNLDLKQEELANLVGVRRETIVHLEAGRYNPSLRLGMQIAKVLGTTVEELFTFPQVETLDYAGKLKKQAASSSCARGA